ncbi:hypothetical protein LTR99_008736 [Exophiala xenobiotica]|uniref:Uncharacterized protein n=1 Tax=Vermiconidia calcicola TaxID=1690605 RepID=A0AAV9Q3P9_9PEZI|nr:hypothetical protein LTR92_009632 [Exophiala xenobiotica]KAK5533380.1 hypothetical protein LTR25_007246 [Vermiconidia calcicola]KAK5542842.1 hypothetical protein LTR23_005167 [Chaetothyriales sp. CCFEE 6169]KAK5205837.1 hypothetical protein LTR41_008519 [Exophiala xenobiotica]KAK5225330.1 hypothetical protein LTR47_009392 [Exophiala xenobiotica]
MAQGLLKKPSKPAAPAKSGLTKKGSRTFAPKKAKLLKQAKITKKYTAGLTAKTEAMLGERVGHLELLGHGRKKNTGAADAGKGGKKSETHFVPRSAHGDGIWKHQSVREFVAKGRSPSAHRHRTSSVQNTSYQENKRERLYRPLSVTMTEHLGYGAEASMSSLATPDSSNAQLVYRTRENPQQKDTR